MNHPRDHNGDNGSVGSDLSDPSQQWEENRRPNEDAGHLQGDVGRPQGDARNIGMQALSLASNPETRDSLFMATLFMSQVNMDPQLGHRVLDHMTPTRPHPSRASMSSTPRTSTRNTGNRSVASRSPASGFPLNDSSAPNMQPPTFPVGKDEKPIKAKEDYGYKNKAIAHVSDTSRFLSVRQVKEHCPGELLCSYTSKISPDGEKMVFTCRLHGPCNARIRQRKPHPRQGKQYMVLQTKGDHHEDCPMYNKQTKGVISFVQSATCFVIT